MDHPILLSQDLNPSQDTENTNLVFLNVVKPPFLLPGSCLTTFSDSRTSGGMARLTAQGRRESTLLVSDYSTISILVGHWTLHDHSQVFRVDPVLEIY
jgi:hypothetical protein